MEQIKTFLDTSTIHGLSWISGTRRFSRLFWILIVFGGFTGAVYLIYQSFDNWHQSPISTTSVTMPISQIIFPNVTVCPPKKSFLNLNYDMKQSENVKLDTDTRKELFEYAQDVIEDDFYKEVMANLSKVEDKDRYYNWYHGYTKIRYPYYNDNYLQLYHKVYTSATSGNISTQYFGEKFDIDKIEDNILINIEVHVPESVKDEGNSTLMFHLNKITMKERSENDQMSMDDTFIESNLTKWKTNITAPFDDYFDISLDRKVSVDETKDMNLHMMPGFTLSWKYDKHVEPVAIYSDEDNMKQFVRYL